MELEIFKDFDAVDGGYRFFTSTDPLAHCSSILVELMEASELFWKDCYVSFGTPRSKVSVHIVDGDYAMDWTSFEKEMFKFVMEKDFEAVCVDVIPYPENDCYLVDVALRDWNKKND